MEKHRIEGIEHPADSVSWRAWLHYLRYAEHRTRRSAIVLQMAAMLAWLAGVLVAPAGTGYNSHVLLACGAGQTTAIALSAADRHVFIGMLGRILFLLVLTKSFDYLVIPSANQLMWSMTLCAVILVAMSPLYNEPLSFLLCAGSVCHQLVLSRLDMLQRDSEASWMAVLIVSSFLVGVMLNFFYFSERTRAYLSSRRLMEMAYIDSLTGINNRRAFLDQLERACRRSHTTGGFYFLLIDVDDFKAVNDHHGHAKGDLVLQQVAGQICRLAGEHACGRLGGEEFGIVFEGNEAQAIDFARSINSRIAAASAGGLGVTVSIGLAYHAKHDTLEAVMLQADKALYQAKSAGKNRAILASGKGNLQ